MKYGGYTINQLGFNYYVTDPKGYRAFSEMAPTVEMAKKWIDWEVYDRAEAKRRRQASMKAMKGGDSCGTHGNVSGVGHDVLR
ncbi:MAG: hypothetical protein WC822_01410 [Candidatus Paceibacterota bacterium]|jgi:hypothetical protein